MTLTSERPAPPSVATRPTALWLLAAGWAAHVAVRLVLGWGRDGPIIHPDEPGYLLAARWLAGGPGADLSGLTFYQGGYALLLVPAYWVSNDPETVYRLVVVINALVGALLFPLGRLAALRCGLPPRHAFGAAWVAALLPAVLLYGGLAMADAVLPVLVLGWLLALDRMLREGSPWAGALAGLAAAGAYSVHARGTIVLLVHALAVGWVLARGPARRTAAWALASAAGVGGLAWWWNGRISAALYPEGTRELGGILVDRLTSFDGLLHTATAAGGQLWAMAAGTWGFGAVGLAAATMAAIRPRERFMARVLLAVTLGTAVASAAALPDEHRVGNIAYGRYMACFALVYALVGLAVVLRERSPVRYVAAAAAGVCAFGVWLVVYLGDRLDTLLMTVWDFPETALLGGSYYELRPVAVSVAASLLLAVLAALTRWGRARGLVAFGLVSLTMTYIPATVWTLGETLDPAPELPVVSGRVAFAQHMRGVPHPEPDVVNPAPELVYSRIATKVGWTRLERFNPDTGLPGPGFCAAVLHWPAGLQAADTWPRHPPGWHYQRAGTLGVLWWVVWYDPNCP